MTAAVSLVIWVRGACPFVSARRLVLTCVAAVGAGREETLLGVVPATLVDLVGAATGFCYAGESG